MGVSSVTHPIAARDINLPQADREGKTNTAIDAGSGDSHSSACQVVHANPPSVSVPAAPVPNTLIAEIAAARQEEKMLLKISNHFEEMEETGYGEMDDEAISFIDEIKTANRLLAEDY